ncbi:MAG: GNAT family N-acetyltransferase [Candidatus Latescibacteria bacterium]|nr:GNAT family N-acetyltransferase [Candidatus Latescibacterota bacterium]
MRCLQEWSGVDLVPYGIDTDEKWRPETQEIFPDHKDHFLTYDIDDLCDNWPSTFPPTIDYIYCSLWGTSRFNTPESQYQLQTLLDRVSNTGRLILGLYGGNRFAKGSDADKQERTILTNTIHRIQKLDYNISGQATSTSSNNIAIWIDKSPQVSITIHPLQDGEAETCENILRALPSWFGIEEAIVEYCGDIKKMETYVAKIDDQVVGFLTLNTHNEFTAEIQVIAVKEDTHRQGVGKQLTHHIENILQTRTMEYLTVKTLGPSKASKEYDLTRQFYMAMGFRPLEENDLWGKDNPCLIMVKSITRQ